MVPQTITYQPRVAKSFIPKAFILKLNAIAKSVSPRPHLASSAGLLLTGVLIPVLMLLGLMPATLFLGFITLALIAVGGLLVVYFV